MKRRDSVSGEEAAPACSDLEAILRAGLEQMEARLNRCIVIDMRRGVPGAEALLGASLEEKAPAFLCEGNKSDPENSLSWLASVILDTEALFEKIIALPDAAAKRLAEFLARWGGDTDAPAWAGKSPVERLRLLLTLFDAALGGFEEGMGTDDSSYLHVPSRFLG